MLRLLAFVSVCLRLYAFARVCLHLGPVSESRKLQSGEQ